MKSKAKPRKEKPFVSPAEKRRQIAARKAENAKFRKELATLKRVGVYSPKSTKRTKYRERRIREGYREFADQLNPLEYLFVPVKKQRRKILAKTAQFPDVFKNTKKGLFVAREGYAGASLKTDKSGEARVERFNKIRTGPSGKSQRFTSSIPIASFDELDRQRDRLEKVASDLGPLKDGEQLVYIVHDNGSENYGRNRYGDIESMMNKLYSQSGGAAREAGTKRTLQYAGIMRHIEVRKISEVQWRKTVARIERKRDAGIKRRRKFRRLRQQRGK
jgi:hypothetical protein